METIRDVSLAQNDTYTKYWSLVDSWNSGRYFQYICILKTIQVLRHHVFDSFRPTYLISISSYPPTYLYIFFSSINQAKIRRSLFLLKTNYIHTNFGSFFFKIPKKVHFLFYPRKESFVFLFLLTSAFGHPHPKEGIQELAINSRLLDFNSP